MTDKKQELANQNENDLETQAETQQQAENKNDNISLSPLKLAEAIKKRKSEISTHSSPSSADPMDEHEDQSNTDEVDDYEYNDINKSEETPTEKLRRKLISEKNLSRRLTKRIKELENAQIHLQDIYNEALLKAKFESIIGEEKTNQLFPVIDVKKFYSKDGDLDFDKATEFIKAFSGSSISSSQTNDVLNNKKASGVKVVNPLGSKPKSNSEYTIDLEDLRRLEKQ